MQDFKNLKVWRDSHLFTLTVYALTNNFPREEIYGLTAQLRRATSSISINIAEGCGRGSDADFRRFLQMSMGSATETEYLLILCKDLKYIENEFDSLTSDIKEIKKMLSSLIKVTKTDGR